MRVLYLAPLIPSTSGSGGRRAVFNHLAELARSSLSVDLVCVDVEDEGIQSLAVPTRGKVTVLPRSIPRAGTSSGMLRGVIQLLSSSLPRSADVLASRAGRGVVVRALRSASYDLVVLDHLSAWSLLRGNRIDCPVCYIAHNIERDVVEQDLRQPGHSRAERLRLGLELWKTSRFEEEVLQRADAVVAIATSDRESPTMRRYWSKVDFWPELPEPKRCRWLARATGHLLFVGAARYYPNLEAIDWLVKDFMPALRVLLPGATLRIAGTAALDVPHLPPHPSILMEGFVSDERLEQLHLTAALFVSPVVLGSGVKIKVLEAASYGLPVTGTPESLRSIPFLTGASHEISRNAHEAAAAITLLLGNQEQLKSMAGKASDQLALAIASRRSLASVLENASKPRRSE